MSRIVLKGPAPLMSVLGLDEGVGKVGAFVSINGYTWKVPRGEEVSLPPHVVDYMRECGFTVQEKGA